MPFTITINAASSDPSWYTALANNEGHVFASSAWNSALGPYPDTAGNSLSAGGFFRYSGGDLNTVGVYEGATFRAGPWLCLHGGGHEDYNGNEIACFGPLNAESPDWIWTAGANPVTNTNFSGNQPVSQHTYGHLVYLESTNELLIPAITSRYTDSSGAAVSSKFRFSVASPDSNLTTAWKKSPDVANVPSAATGGLFGAASCYDATADVAYFIGGWGITYVAAYDVQANTWTRYPTSGSNGQEISYSDRKVAAIDPVTKVIMVVSGDAAPWCLDARSPASNFYQPAGSNRPNGSGGLLFDTVNRRWVYYIGGNTMWVCPVPTNPYAGGDSFNWSSVTITGDTLPSLPSYSGNGVWNRFRFCPSPQGYVACVGYNTDLVFIRVN